MNLLQESYKALEKNSGEALQANMNKIAICYRDAKRKALAIEQERLSKRHKSF
jgi:chemotaxis protein MotB